MATDSYSRYLIESEDVVEFARRLEFEPDARQADVLRCDSKRVLLNCSRQWGKSTVTALKAVHRAWFEPNALVMVTGPAGRQAGEFLLKARDFVARLGVTPRGDGQNERSILLPNGSRMVGVPSNEQNLRGFSAASMLVIDEASRASVPATECSRFSKEFKSPANLDQGCSSYSRSLRVANLKERFRDLPFLQD